MSEPVPTRRMSPKQGRVAAMKLRVFRKHLSLRHVKTTAVGSVSSVGALFVELEQDGLVGFGECCQEDRLSLGMLDALHEKIARFEGHLKNYALADPFAFERFISPHFEREPAARCALEMAACDLWGKIRGFPLRRLWKLRSAGAVYSSFTLVRGSRESTLDKLDETPDWPIYRVELNGRDDIPLLEEIRRKTDARLYIEVAGQWTLSQALDYLPRLIALKVDLLEQPFPADAWEQTKIFKKHSPIPVYADESCRSLEDIERCVGIFDGVNLTPVKFGGMLATRRAIVSAQALGLKTMIGNPTESTVGASAAAQFAPVLDAVCIDGPCQIKQKIGLGIEFDRGRILYPKIGGTGVSSAKTAPRPPR